MFWVGLWGLWGETQGSLRAWPLLESCFIWRTGAPVSVIETISAPVQNLKL